jgi:hypothetical protein
MALAASIMSAGTAVWAPAPVAPANMNAAARKAVFTDRIKSLPN